jgi:hypothetical protein
MIDFYQLVDLQYFASRFFACVKESRAGGIGVEVTRLAGI